jgi:hypothetical protein
MGLYYNPFFFAINKAFFFAKAIPNIPLSGLLQMFLHLLETNSEGV